MYDETSADTVTITVIATGLDGDTPSGSFTSKFGTSTPSFLNKSASTPQRSGLSFLDGFGNQTKSAPSSSPVSSVQAARPMGGATRQVEEMPVINNRAAAPVANDNQGMEGIKIPTFIQNKKQEG